VSAYLVANIVRYVSKYYCFHFVFLYIENFIGKLLYADYIIWQIKKQQTKVHNDQTVSLSQLEVGISVMVD